MSVAFACFGARCLALLVDKDGTIIAFAYVHRG
jgi:hypothetical protein